MTTFDIIAKYREGLLRGLWETLWLCVIVWSIGLSSGTLLAIVGARAAPFIGMVSRGASFVLSSIPVLVILFWLHYPAQALLGIEVPGFRTAATTLAVLNALAVADTIRPSLRSFPREYVLSARVCGLTSATILKSIQLPIILRQTIPALLMIQVSMLQATLFASLISVDELFRVAQQINSLEHQPVRVYSALAIFFLAVCLPLNVLAFVLQRRFSRDLSDQ